MIVYNHIPDLIAEYERKLGRRVQQREIAQGSDIPEGTLSRYINSRVGGLKLDVEYRLCVYFSKKLGRRIGRDDLFSFGFEVAS